MSEAPTAPEPKRTRSRRVAWIGAVVALVVIAGIVALVWWAIALSQSREPVARTDTFERYRSGWTSAMNKAGVQATFPDGPVDIAQVTPTGRHDFEATFTAEEITALVNVYRFETQITGEAASITAAEVTFPNRGTGRLAAQLTLGGASYNADVTAPLTYSPKGLDSPGPTDLSVEGFSVGGARRRQAGEAVLAYLNLYLRAAPGLTLERAEIAEDGVRVKGAAPQRLEHPDPLTP